MSGKSFVVNNDAESPITFNPTILVSGGTQYVDSGSSTSSPRVAIIKHTMPPLNQTKALETHLLQFQHLVADAVGNPFFATVNVTVKMPRVGPTRANLDDLLAFVSSFISDSTKMSAFIQGDY